MAVIKTEIILFIQNNHIYNFYNSTFQKIKWRSQETLGCDLIKL